MENNFKFNSKYKRISLLEKSIENRLNKMDDLNESIKKDFIKIRLKYDLSSSESPDGMVADLNKRFYSIANKVFSHKKNFKQISHSVSQTEKMITQDQNSFSSNYSNFDDLDSNNSEFNTWINEGDYLDANDALTKKFIDLKISHKFVKPLSDSTVKNIVKLNSESFHINKAIEEIKKLQQEIIKDYLRKRNEVMAKNLFKGETNKVIQLVSEQLTCFNSSQEANSVVDSFGDVLYSVPVAVGPHRCLGRTASCGVTH